MKRFYRKLFLLEHLGLIVLLLFGGALFVSMWYFDKMGTPIFVLFVSVIVFFIIYYIKEMLTIDPLAKIKEYCLIENYSFDEIEADFNAAQRLGIRQREGARWIFYMDMQVHPNLILKKDIVYMEYRLGGRDKGNYLAAYDKNNKITRIPMSKRKYNKIQSHQDTTLRMNTFYRDRYEKRDNISFAVILGLTILVMIITYFRITTSQIVLLVEAGISAMIITGLIDRKSSISFHKMEEYCKLYGYSIDDLKVEFPVAVERGKNVRESRNWIYFMNKDGMPDVIRKERVTHTEYHGRCLYVYDIEHNLTKIPMCKRKAELLQICR